MTYSILSISPKYLFEKWQRDQTLTIYVLLNNLFFFENYLEIFKTISLVIVLNRIIITGRFKNLETVYGI